METYSLPPPEPARPLTVHHAVLTSVVTLVSTVEVVQPAIPHLPIQPTNLARRQDKEFPHSADESLTMQGGVEELD